MDKFSSSERSFGDIGQSFIDKGQVYLIFARTNHHMEVCPKDALKFNREVKERNFHITMNLLHNHFSMNTN
jgi:hypothetical protein